MARGKIDFTKILEENNVEQENISLKSTPVKELVEKLEKDYPEEEQENVTNNSTENINDSSVMELKGDLDLNELNTNSEDINTNILENHSAVEVECSDTLNSTQIYPNNADYYLYDLDYDFGLKDADIEQSVVNLPASLDDFLNIRSNELGISIQQYYNLLFAEYRYDIEHNGIKIDNEIVNQMKLNGEGKVRRTTKTTKELFAWTKAASAVHGFNISELAKYIILKEMKREQTSGKRLGKYNAFNFTFVNND